MPASARAPHDVDPSLRSGDDHYRAYIGGPKHYDRLSAEQFTMLLQAGLREDDPVLDLGCGSLRLGRLLIPFLKPDRYCGVEPNRWLVEAGLDHELGRDILDVKRPRFRYVEDFSVAEFGERFDYAMAYSVFSHAYPDLCLHGMRAVGESLSDEGLLMGTFLEVPEPPAGAKRSRLSAVRGSGWLYPEAVRYTWQEFADVAAQAGLIIHRVGRQTGKQRWFVAGKASAEPVMRWFARRAVGQSLWRRDEPPWLTRLALLKQAAERRLGRRLPGRA